ncbi:hypothetical protein DESAMIL20_843 [Desulfurella amilsii]|uniref:Uncharacterized protein n=1 Tax=Desulfurella amilsii TaxID=1562698 RepID=A0A1X4XUT4_9BACT|nr:hypothetical protein DESAMIL20_843 [Desulfurella amilsii]
MYAIYTTKVKYQVKNAYNKEFFMWCIKRWGKLGNYMSIFPKAPP